MEKGLYSSAYEHDACGVGMVVNIHGNKSHELVDNALKVLENMRHRGAEGADNKTGDGAGIMLQIPHEFILLQGIPVPEKGKYGTGLVFLPKDEKKQQDILSIMIEEIEREGLQLMHLRNVPLLPGTVLPGISAGAWASLPCPVASSPHRQARSHSPTVRRLPFSPARTGQLQNQSHPHLHHIRSSGNACPASCWGSYRCGTGSKPSRFCLPGFRNAPQPVLS